MRFIYPYFLWALLLIAVPIIIHLVNLRRHRTVYFSNVNFLKLVRKETKRKSKIKQLLILASRILMIIALILAFAKPYIPTTNIQKQRAVKAVGIYIDNSFSMTAEGPEGKAIESAIQKAYIIVNTCEPNTKFALLTNELSEKQNRFYSQNEMKQLISEIAESHNWIPLSTISLRFNNLMQNFLFDTEKSIYFISDFQKHSADLNNMIPDSTINYFFVPISVNTGANLFLDSCWFESPTHNAKEIEILNVNLVNQSSEDYRQIPVNFYINDSLKALASIDINANEKKTVVLQYTNTTSGTVKGRIEINDYPIVHDNILYLTYNVKSNQKVLLINDGQSTPTNRYFEALFPANDFISLETERSDRIKISNLLDFSTIYLNELKTLSTGLAVELQKYISNGGTLVIIPSEKCDINAYNQFLTMIEAPLIQVDDTIQIPMNQVLYEHELYANVFKESAEKVALPSIKYRYRFAQNQLTNQTSILTFADATNALSEVNYGNGKLYTFSFPLSNKKNDFVNHILFLPTIYNIALYSSATQKLYYTMGVDPYFEWKNTKKAQMQDVILKHLQTGTEFVPKFLSQGNNTLNIEIENDFDAGFYALTSENNELGVMAYNYKLDESDLTYHSRDEITNSVRQKGFTHFQLIDAKNENFASLIAQLDNGKQLWRLFIFLAILFIMIEALIIKFWP